MKREQRAGKVKGEQLWQGRKRQTIAKTEIRAAAPAPSRLFETTEKTPDAPCLHLVTLQTSGTPANVGSVDV